MSDNGFPDEAFETVRVLKRGTKEQDDGEL